MLAFENDFWRLCLDLNNYRKKYLLKKPITISAKRRKYVLLKGTPDVIVKQFHLFYRKINNQPIFNEQIKADYLSGIKQIYSDYYNELSTMQGESWKQRKLAAEASLYMIELDRKRIMKWERKKERERKLASIITP